MDIYVFGAERRGNFTGGLWVDKAIKAPADAEQYILLADVKKLITEKTELQRRVDTLIKERTTMLSLLERNEHNYHRLGALGSTDMKIIMETLQRDGD